MIELLTLPHVFVSELNKLTSEATKLLVTY